MSPRVPFLAFTSITLAAASGCAAQPCSPTFPCSDSGTAVVFVEPPRHHRVDPVLAAAELFTAAAVVAATASSHEPSGNPQSEWTTEEGPGDDGPAADDAPPLRVRLGPVPPHERPSAADTRVESHTQFDLGGAYAALAHVDLDACKVQGLAPGYGKVRIAFDHGGAASSVRATLPSGSSAAAQACVEAAFKQVQVARFDGTQATVRRAFFVQG